MGRNTSRRRLLRNVTAAGLFANAIGTVAGATSSSASSPEDDSSPDLVVRNNRPSGQVTVDAVPARGGQQHSRPFDDPIEQGDRLQRDVRHPGGDLAIRVVYKGAGQRVTQTYSWVLPEQGIPDYEVLTVNIHPSRISITRHER